MKKTHFHMIRLLVSGLVVILYSPSLFSQPVQQSPVNQNPFSVPDTLRIEPRPQTQESVEWFRQDPNTDEQARIRQQRTLHNTARQFEFMGQNDRALDMYRRILEMFPTDKQAFDGVQRNLVDLGRYEEAEILLRERLRDPVAWNERAKLLSDLGGVLYQSNKLAEAESTWSQALAVEPVSELNFREVANVQMQLLLLDRAAETYQQGREVLNNPSAFSINLANLYTGQMDWENATEEYLRVLSESDRRVHYVRRGLANYPNSNAANRAVTTAIRAELEATRRNEPWNGYRITLHELLIDQLTKNGDYADALNAVAELDNLEHADGDRLLQFASETMTEGFDEVAADALDIASERMQDPEGLDVVNIMRAQLAEARQDYLTADSLLSLVTVDPASARVERSALMSRGLIRLEYLDRAGDAVHDFRIVRTLGWPPYDRRLDYYEALALVKVDSLDAALVPLRRQVAIDLDQPRRSLGFETSYGLITDADLIHLAARISLWQGDRDLASTLLDSLLNPPVGAPIENESLLLLHMITTTQDTAALQLYATADHAEFAGKDSLALSLFDSLTSIESISEQLAVNAAYTAAFLKLDTGQSSEPIVEFANRFGPHPLVEEAWYRLGQWWENQANSEEAAVAYEMVLVGNPDGLLQELARLRLEELTLQQFMSISEGEEQ